MKLLLAGDLFIHDFYQNKELFDKSLLDLFERSDYRVVNLEAPLTYDYPRNRILKTGRYLCSAPETTMPFLRKLKIDLVTLANNHIMDYGRNGLFDTFASLDKDRIDYVGAGRNLEEAQKIKSYERDGIKIAILNFTENEWSIARETYPGANPLNIIDNINQIRLAKSTHHKVICIIHGGHEYYNLPSPRMVKQYQFYADNGADMIVGHHTHCIGGYELYHGIPIIYSLGNFLFTFGSKYEGWYYGLLLQLQVKKNYELRFEIVPVEQERKSHFTRLCDDARKKAVIEDVMKYSKVLSDSEKLSQLWDEFLTTRHRQYLSVYSPFSFIGKINLTGLLKKLKVDSWLMSRSYGRLLLNIIRCESHSDASKHILEKFINKL